jgi:DNA-directed RNA polymerase subunit M/transcription elongation factor TFIIS
MTIQMNANEKNNIVDFKFIGKKITMICKEIGYSDDLNVCALKVETEVPSLNKIKHVTIYTMNGAKPKESNSITKWEAVKGSPFILEGFVETCI